MRYFTLIIGIFLLAIPVMGEYTGNTTLQDETMVGNQFIVTYKSGKDPEALTALSQKRAQIRSTALGTIRLYFVDLYNRNTPEKNLAIIRRADKKIGLLSRDQINKKTNTYLITVSERVDIVEAMEQYNKLPQVASIQPNYLYNTMSL